MNRTKTVTCLLIGTVISSMPGSVMGQGIETPAYAHRTSDQAEPMRTGQFEPTWESLKQYQCPDWFRDAKFGIWAHWGPQCQPERGDWYARQMYAERGWQAASHRQHYGHPSKSGFKDVIHEWKAERWDPNALMVLYKRAGAQYFMALANHHDNFDLWESEYQPWNSTRIGPKKDLIADWAKAARAQGLRFGVSVHAAHAWTWYETAQGADETGEYAGVPYDGRLTKADGNGQWWEGLNPQDLYAQDHKRSERSENLRSIHAQWNWGNGASIPDQAYCDKFYNRTLDLINTYKPDLVYFDDTVLPLYPISDAGMKIAAHYYNSSTVWHNGHNEAVLLGKILSPEQRKCLVWDVERGASNEIEPYPWQSCSCIGSWHYDRGIYDRNRYKDARTVIHMLVDIVSKNGNLLLSIPLRGDGSIDEKEIEVLKGIAAWMDVNKECLFGTRPWKILGEGPALGSVAALNAQGFNEGRGEPFTAEDVRFTVREDTLYAIVLGWPGGGQARIQSLAKGSSLLDGREIAEVSLLGHEGRLAWSHEEQGLRVTMPETRPSDYAVVLKIKGAL